VKHESQRTAQIKRRNECLEIDIKDEKIMIKVKFLILLSIIAFHGSVHAAKRVALVIGNSQYQSLNTLANPSNDANAIASKLSKLGFKIMSSNGRLGNRAALNINEDQFLNLIDQFAVHAEKADIAMVYYAGHGMQFGMESYLLPVDVEKKNVKLIQRHSVSLENLLKSLDGKANLTIAVFDACREIPELENLITTATRSSGLSKADYRGLQRVRTKGRSRVVAFSGAAGQLVDDGTGRNSPYTAELLKQLNHQGLEVGDVFRKVAYEFGKQHKGQQPEVLIQGVPPQTYYFSAQKNKPVVSNNASQNSAEIAFWNSIQGETHADFFASYLQQYPQGTYQSLAHLKLEQYRIPQVVLNPKIAFTVKTIPENTRVRLLNISPKYQAGMLLKAGRYKVEVSAAGYQKQVNGFQLTQENNVYFVELQVQNSQLKASVQAKVQPIKINNKTTYPRKKHDTAVPANYMTQGNGTVMDADTGLQWMRCHLGQAWRNGACAGEAKKYQWQAALNVGNGYRYAGYSDWRVPIIQELQTLVYCSNGKTGQYKINGFESRKSEGGYGCGSDSRGPYTRPTINTSIFPNAASVVWSSSPVADYSGGAWGINFSSGYTYYNFRNYNSHVRLVRSGQ